MTTPFRLSAYLKRIGIDKQVEASLASLYRIQAAHVGAIPYEGIDRLMRILIDIDIEAIQSKLVIGRRGGNCFEQNLLLKSALEALGFNVIGLAGRVRWMSSPTDPMPPRAHMMLLVDTPEGARLVDVGFGVCLIDAPLTLDVETEQRTAMATFKLTRDRQLYYLSVKRPSGWRTMYAFSLEPQFPADYVMANTYAPLNPNLPFLRNLVAERLSEGKRYKLINRKWTVEGPEGIVLEEHSIADHAELEKVLDERFCIMCPVNSAALFAKLP